MTLRFDNSYARLPDRFYARQAPVPVAEPGLVAVNRALAARLGLDADWLESPAGVAMLAGNAVPEGAEPLAQAYAGHQFGGWVPQLGDGRAILLGEVVAPDGARFDLQLKGAGRTPFSRGGDGRAWLGPVIREYVVSEAMAALGLPTTRALAAVTTGEPVLRETGAMPGAVLARVASSHIRVGTFQYFAARGDEDAIRTLCNHLIERHYPQANGPLDLLRAVVAAQARLIAGWMSFGFIHGVMNTDNMALSGETIDYGPCAFMDAYHPDRVFSSIDRGGRYAYANQPQIGAWNLAQFATCLLPLMGEREAAIEAATEAVHGFGPAFQAEWLARFGAKIGIAAATEADLDLIETLLSRMALLRADFTRTFRGLLEDTARAEFAEAEAFDQWEGLWRDRLAQEADPRAVMARANPARIPRNHRVEEAIGAAVAGDLAPFQRLNAALARPFDDDPAFADYSLAPRTDQIVHRTFCGT
ncbi:protein adenylyltransferase SelO [Phaeovulum sp. NW3]|uniref:protein adenylyltransferase SelO n=1 Tax=Phaeovulum sp. NW3 TaxID=2934933 RepID=UPI00201FDC29|nr:YdiU family protein [Phaeovulum sp. NW3]MCL7464821.1 YdiU family protein [Phaeovulum sp. NW3]